MESISWNIRATATSKTTQSYIVENTSLELAVQRICRWWVDQEHSYSLLSAEIQLGDECAFACVGEVVKIDSTNIGQLTELSVFNRLRKLEMELCKRCKRSWAVRSRLGKLILPMKERPLWESTQWLSDSSVLVLNKNHCNVGSLTELI